MTNEELLSRPLPFEFRDAVARLRDDLPDVLGSRLVGVYLYGSVLDPSFVPGRSDLDCITVTSEALEPAEFDRLGAWLKKMQAEDETFERIQMSLLVRDRVLEDDPSACLYQFGHLVHSGSDGNPIIWLDYLQRGLILLGPDPGEFLPTIGPDVLRQALVRELGYLRDEITTKPESEWRGRASYRAYAVLTLCRILYSAATAQVTSKATAAEWAIHHTPGEADLHDLIRIAVGVSDLAFVARIPLPQIERFIVHVDKVVSAEGARHVP